MLRWLSLEFNKFLSFLYYHVNYYNNIITPLVVSVQDVNSIFERNENFCQKK